MTPRQVLNHPSRLAPADAEALQRHTAARATTHRRPSRPRIAPRVAGARTVPGVMSLALLLTAVILPAHAQSSGPALPIQIASDQADFTQTSGVSTYTGNVQLSRGGLTLTGNRLEVTRINDRGNIQAVLTGNPARIDKQPDAQSNERVTGQAQRIEYTNSNARLVLRGNAQLERDGGDRITSPVITRDLDTGTTQAQGQGSERVRITIQPGQGGS